MLDSSYTATIYFMSTIGLGVLTHAFATATGAFLPHPKPRYLEAFAFIQGSGLEITLQKYGLDYNAERLRSTFMWCVKHQNGSAH